MDIKKVLRQKAQEASECAYSPYSHAKVGSAIEMSDGSIYTGANIENASYGGTICAERVAILKAVFEKKMQIDRENLSLLLSSMKSAIVAVKMIVCAF